MDIEFQKFDLPDCDISYMTNFIELEQANWLFKSLETNIPWQQDDIKVFGKTYAQPRLTSLHSSEGKSYSYSNITMNSKPFTHELNELKKKLFVLTQIKFNACLLNLYRNGQDSNGWHSDDEKELGTNPVIASISLGEERSFQLRHKFDSSLKHKLVLKHGSLLLMKGTTQHYWQHQVPKTKKQIEKRINLTFRVIQ